MTAGPSYVPDKSGGTVARWRVWLGWMLHVARPVLGILFIAVGILGLFLPILQGILFLGIGLALLGIDVNKLRRFKTYLQQRYPRVFQRLNKG